MQVKECGRDEETVKTLLSEEQIQAGVRRMADDIHARLGRAPLTIIGVLTGSLLLMADLVRLLEMPLRVGMVEASSYRGGTTRGQLTVRTDLLPDLEGRRVLLVDDIFDTGHTLREICRQVHSRRPASLHSAVLLRKQGRQEVVEQPDFVGFDIPDAFVVGYGLDYRDAYRNLPFVAVLEAGDMTDEPA